MLKNKNMKLDKNRLKYDVILQNCGSKKVFLFQKQTDVSENTTYLTFNIDLSELPSGDYNYAILVNMRDDVIYDMKADLKRTIAKTTEGDVELRLLKPMMGILRIETTKEGPIYYNETVQSVGFQENNKIYFYKD